MVAYDTVAYGSLLRIVAYEVPMFHVLIIIKHEKMRKYREDSALLIIKSHESN